MNCINCGSLLEPTDSFCGDCGVEHFSKSTSEKKISVLLAAGSALFVIFRFLSGGAKAFSKGTRGQYAQETDTRWRERLHGEYLESEATFEEKPNSINATKLREAKKRYAKSLK